jgi:hypothetical protein
MTWLKMDHTTPEKPEVLAITLRMGWDDPDMTVGKLFRLWRWFDQQTVDGNAQSVSTALLDRLVGVSGFCEVVASVGWLVVTDAGVILPGFDKHNGQSAKDRANTAKRVAKHSGKRSTNGLANGASVSRPLPREEKNREEQIQEDPPASRAPPADAGQPARPRAVKRCPESFDPGDELRAWALADAPRADFSRELAKFRDHTFKTAHSDWSAAFRNWLRRASDETRNRPQSFMAEKKAEMSKWLKGTSLDTSTQLDYIDATPLPLR